MSKSRRMTWTEKQPALSHSPAAGAESLLCLQFMHLNPAFWHDIQGPSLLLLPLSDLFCLDSYYFSELIFTAGQEEFILEFIPVLPRNVFQPPDALALLWSLPRMPPTCPSPTHPWHCFLLTFPGTLLFLVLSLLASQQGGSFLHQSPPLSGLSCRHGCWGSASILSEEQEECPFSVLVWPCLILFLMWFLSKASLLLCSSV